MEATVVTVLVLVLLPIHNVEKMRGADATLPDRVGPDAPLRRERQEIPMGELQDSLHCHTCSARHAGGGITTRVGLRGPASVWTSM